MDAQALTEAFRRGCFAVALSGLGAAILAACGVWLFRQARRLHASCQGQSVLRRLALMALLVLAFTVGGTKTNGVNNLPPQQKALPQLQPVAFPQPAAPRLQGSLPVTNLAPIATWSRTGAYSNEYVIEFPENWCFPHGTNHLASVALVARGEVFPSEQAEDPLAALATPLSVKPGESEVVHGPTTNDSYRIEWHACSRSRTVFDPTDAAIEFCRNGDVEVTENGVTTRTPRTLPFAHDGYGQDAEWVTANFTNATEILAVGYPQWVDAQVGTDLTNGLYKLTVTVSEDPPEMTQIMVGDLSIAVTNAGEYVFLLGKCIDYPLAVFPETATNFTYTAVDDVVPASGGAPLLGAPPGGWWSSDAQAVAEIVVPYAPMTPFGPTPHVKWNAKLAVSPRAWFPTPANPSETFAAVLEDVPFWLTTAYAWSSSDSAKVSVSVPAAPVTQMTWLDPDAFDDVSLTLVATVGSDELHAYFYPLDDENPVSWTWRGTNVKVDIPATLFVNNDDDDAAGGLDWLQETHAANDEDVVRGRLALTSDSFLEGTFALDAITGLTGGFAPDSGVYAGHDGTGEMTEGWSCRVNGVFNQEIYLNPSRTSAAYRDASLHVTWTPDNGDPIPFLRRFTVVEPIVEPVCSATTNVEENGVLHVYTVNPCGVVVGREAYFRIALSPDDYPDSEIVWGSTAEGAVEFVSGNTGRQVTVRGLAPGETQLTVQIGDSRSAPPEFPVHVVTNVAVNLRAWIIRNEKIQSFSVEAVRQMVKDANDIYAQVGVTLNLIEPIVVTNIPGAYNALRQTPASPSTTWDYWNIVDLDGNSGCLECYFINSFIDAPNTKAANSEYGLVMTTKATRYTLAHEIGHAFGMRDIYVTNLQQKDGVEPLVSLLPSEKATSARLAGDWNGGCSGFGSEGTRYYRLGTSMEQIVGRMLMLGEVPEEDVRRDITAGGVYGVYYTDEDSQTRIWHKGNAPVGFPWGSRSPTHK